MIKLITPKNNSTISLLRKEHIDFIADPTAAECVCLSDASFPAPAVFSFEPPIDAEIILPDSHGRQTTVKAKNGQAKAYNLLIGEKYSWRVKCGLMTSEEHCFFTDPTPPRMLYAEGISNLRDIGGFETTDERLIKQGMVYRSTESDKNYSITENGRNTLINELGIKTELDVRGINGEATASAFPRDKIKRLNIPLSAYGEIFNEQQMAAYKSAFELFAVPSSYPILIHCQSGMDRTGTLIFILGALVGADEGDLMLDYEMSSFSTWGRRSRTSPEFSEFLDKLHSYGASARQAAEGFLTACGVTNDNLKRIRDILTEEKE